MRAPTEDGGFYLAYNFVVHPAGRIFSGILDRLQAKKFFISVTGRK
jgi:hypothetical protein